MSNSAAETGCCRSLAELQRTVVSGGFCVGCGACAFALGPQAGMNLSEYGRYEPTHRGLPEACNDRSSIEGVCPFADGNPDEDALAKERYAEECDHDRRLGYVRACYAAHVLEGRFRETGSSGGIVSWLATELLQLGLVDGVAHVCPQDCQDSRPPLFRYRISRTREQVLEGSSSRYYPVEMSRILAEIRTCPGHYAIIGLPCFIKATRLLTRRDLVARERIAYAIGLVCGHLKSTGFAEMLAWQCDVVPGYLYWINFRKKLAGRPANKYGIEVIGRNGLGQPTRMIRPVEEIAAADWGLGLFKYKACDFCDDIFAETADVVVGDAWLPRYASDDRGTNVVVARERRIDLILREAAAARRIWLEPLSRAEVVKSQSANFRHRREALAYRLYLADESQQWRPKKRIDPSLARMSGRTRRLQRLRLALAERSHFAFRKAVDAKDLKVFSRELEPLLREYDKVRRGESGALIRRLFLSLKRLAPRLLGWGR